MNNSYSALRNVVSFRNTGKSQPISGIELVVDAENMYFAGSDDGYVMTIECPYGTQQMANDLLAKAKGFEYQGYTAEQVVLPPEAELGDGINVAGVYGMIAYRSFKFTPGMTSTVEAPRELEVQHEYTYTSPQQRRVQRQIAQTKTLITKTSEEINLKIEATDGRVSDVAQTVDSIVLRVTDASGVTSEVKLTEAGKIDLTGYATFRGLLEGTTVIDGGCIKADTKIESPVIVGGTIYAGTPKNMLGYLKMVNDGLEVYNKDGLLKFRIGYTSSDFDYPYIQLGSGNGGGANSRGIVKKFVDGLWIGNGIATDATGNFSPQAGYNGIFVKFTDGKTYVVNGSNMMNVYTGDAIARFG